MTTTPAPVELAFLGPPEVRRGGSEVAFDTRKAVALLAYLALTDGGHRRDALAALLWPDSDQGKGRAALRRTLSSVRSALGAESMLVTGETIALDPEVVRSDAAEFRRLAASGASDPAALTAAVIRYRGDFLDGFSLRDSPEFDDWQFYQAESFRRELGGILQRLVGLLAPSEPEAAMAHARRWLSLDRLNEAAHRALMELLARTDQRSAALRQYRECARILARELGVEPLPETTELARAIEQGKLEQHPGRAVGEEARAVRPGATSELPLVGREAEWSGATAAYGQATTGHLLVVEGEAGIGKTRLATALVREAVSRGARTGQGRAYPGEQGVPYAPLLSLLRSALAAPERLESVPGGRLAEIGRILPERAAPGGPPAMDSPAAFTRFVDAVAEVLLSGVEGSPPGVLFVDDVQWADTATLDVLSYLIRRLRGRGVLVVLAWRAEEVQPDHRLRALVAERRRSNQVTVLSLGRLSPVQVAQLVGSEGGGGDVARAMFDQTEGVPFFVVEYLRARRDGRLGAGIPEGVRALLRSRLDGLSPLAVQVLSTAAVIGRSFDEALLERSAGRSDEEVVEGLEELLARGLVVQSGGEFGFGHDRMRELVHDETAEPRRRLLHGRVAEALAFGPSADERAAVVARHLDAAGRSSEAVPWYERAGTRARRVFANAEAVAHLGRALELGSPDRGRILETIGDALTALGRYGEAAERYEAARREVPGRSATIDRRLGGIELRLGRWEEADRRLAAALRSLPVGAMGERAGVLADRSLAAYRRSDLDGAERLAAEALDLATAAGDRATLAQAHNVLGILAKARGDLDAAIGHLGRSSEEAASLADPEARAAALNNLALATKASGRIEEAREYAEQALALASSAGDVHREAAIRNNLADLLHLAGRSEEAMEELKRAVALFAEVSSSGADPSPEIWKLVDW